MPGKAKSASFSIVCILALQVMAAAQLPPHRDDSSHRSALSFGAVADGTTKNTAVLQKAIDTVSNAGGGTIFFPAGRYLTGTLILKSRVTLHLDNGAVLLGSTDLSDYRSVTPAFPSYTENYVVHALIYAEKAENIGIEGAGTIDGQGGHQVFQGGPPAYKFKERPYLIRFAECRNVRVTGVTLRDAAMWVQQYLACDNVILDGLTVISHCNNNNDMFDIDGCHDVRISNCKGETGDDAITLKSTGPRACERVTVTNCTVSTPCSGIKLGSESSGGFRDITITNCVVRRPLWQTSGQAHYTEGIGIEMVDGGTLERVTMSNIVVEGARAAIFIRLGNRARPYTSDAPKPGMGVLRDVTISNIIARGTSTTGCSITGIPGQYVENVTLRDLRIIYEGGGKLPDATRQPQELPEEYPCCWMFGRLPAYGLYVRHVKGLTLENVQFDWEQPDYRPALICDDVYNLNVNGLQAAAVKGGSDMIRLHDVDTAMIRGCVAPEAGVGFLSASGNTKSISIIGNDLSRSERPLTLSDTVRAEEIFEAANRHRRAN